MKNSKSMRNTVIFSLLVLFLAGACQKKGEDGPAKYVRFTKPDLTISNYAGENDSVTIQSNTDWKLNVNGSAKDVIQLSQVSGSGNATVKINLTEELEAGATVDLVLSDPSGKADDAHCIVYIHEYTFTMQWSNKFGGSRYDEVNNICLFAPDQFLLSGFTGSPDVDAAHNFGADNALTLIVDANGTLQGQRKAGGSNLDQFLSVAPSGDGGYIAVGYTYSNDREVVGHHGIADAWIVKFNSNHDTVWTRTWGGSGNDYASVIVAAPGGNFLIAGMTSSDNGDFPGARGETDNWLMKINGNGQQQWQQFTRMGGNSSEDVRGMAVTGDGGCILTGYSLSSDISGTVHWGFKDAYITKVAAGGQIEWQKLIGGNSDDQAYAVTCFPDGSILFAGSSRSSRTTSYGLTDGWLYKMDNAGNVLWDKNFGTQNTEYLTVLTATADGGCIAGGLSFNDGLDVSGSKGNGDAWLLKINASGHKVWHKVIGGSNSDNLKAISQTSNGDLIIAGTTISSDGDLAGPLKGETDIWMARLKVQ